MESNDLSVLDARNESEFISEHIDSNKVSNFPLDFINENLGQLNKDTEYHIHCAGGYRSMITASILKSRGFNKIIDVAGGFKAIKEADFKLTAFVCPSTLK